MHLKWLKKIQYNKILKAFRISLKEDPSVPHILIACYNFLNKSQ